MIFTFKKLTLIPMVIMTLALVGCSSKGKQQDGGESDSIIDDSSMDRPLEMNGTSDSNTAGGLSTVYFDYDSSSISGTAKMTLEENANFLKDNEDVQIQIEGHCDERGGQQYNLALGERRARAVKDFLISLGVDENRVSIISMGKNTPLEYGHNDDAWSKNRRANFTVTGK